MKRTILITGGLGFIGFHILNALTNDSEHRVVSFDIQAGNNRNPDIITVKGDIFNNAELVKTVHEHEITDIVHMIGLASIPNCRKKPDASFHLNVASVQNVLEAMRQCDVERLIFPSTAAVYGVTNGPQLDETARPRPSNIYGLHKLAAELLIHGYAENYGIKDTILRIFNVYGDLDKEQGVVSMFIRKAMANEPLIVKGGDQLRDFVFLGDVVQAFTKSLDNKASHGRTINVGSGIGVSIKEIAAMVQQGFPEVKLKHEPADIEEYSIYANISQMKNILGFSSIDPREGIPRFIEKCKETNGPRSTTQ